MQTQARDLQRRVWEVQRKRQRLTFNRFVKEHPLMAVLLLFVAAALLEGWGR